MRTLLHRPRRAPATGKILRHSSPGGVCRLMFQEASEYDEQSNPSGQPSRSFAPRVSRVLKYLKKTSAKPAEIFFIVVNV